MEAPPQALALLGAGMWVCYDKIGELRVQSSSGKSVPFVEHILSHTRGDSKLF